MAAEDVGSTLVANAAVSGVVRGAWVAVADGLAAWYLAFLARGNIPKPVRVHLLPQMMVCPW